MAAMAKQQALLKSAVQITNQIAILEATESSNPELHSKTNSIQAMSLDRDEGAHLSNDRFLLSSESGNQDNPGPMSDQQEEP